MIDKKLGLRSEITVAFFALVRESFAITVLKCFYIPYYKNKALIISALFCGKTGIRTLGSRKGTTVFETAPIDHSGIFPWSCF